MRTLSKEFYFFSESDDLILFFLVGDDTDATPCDSFTWNLLHRPLCACDIHVQWRSEHLRAPAGRLAVSG